eukprot:XP_001692744.1 importin beta [Chlamydomonas reinhardtii]
MDPAAAVAAIAANPAAFTELVAQLQDADNDRRKSAEAIFDALKEQSDLCMTCLARTLRTCPAVEARLFCSVMIRKCMEFKWRPFARLPGLQVIYYRSESDLKAPVLWDKCSPAVQTGTKQALLEALVQEPDRNVSSKVSTAVSDLAALIYDKAGWPELMPAITAMLTSSNQQQDFVNMLVTMLGSGVKDVTVGAANAVTAFIEPMLAVLGQLLSSGDEEEARGVLEMFIVLAESSARFLRPHLIPLVDAMMRVAGAGDSLEPQTRQLAVEFLVSLCEAREQSPGMMRKVPNLARTLFELVMGFLLDIEDDPAWHSAADDSNEDAGAGELYDPGQEYLDRLALSLGGKAVSDAAAPLLGTWITDAQWQKRAAVFICLAQIAEGCTKVMSTTAYLEQLARMCVMGLKDAQPHVRWAACQALGQMCTDLGPELQARHHAAILPSLMEVMDNFNAPRVQAHACAAIVNFSEGVEADVLPPYLDGLIQKLLTLLQHGARLVQEGALTALASVADSSQVVDEDEEKATAVNMLSCYAEELKEGFWAYVGPVLKLVLNGVEGQSPLIKFYLNEERGVPGASPAAVAEFLGAAWGPLLEALRKEPEGEIQAVQLDSIGEIVEVVPDKALLGAEPTAAAFKIFDTVLEKMGDDVLPLVESLLMTRYGAMLTVLPILLEATRSDHADLRQCAVYGLGVMAAKAPAELFRPQAAAVAEIMAGIIRHPEAKSEDNDMATDNAVAALGRVLSHHPEALGPDGGAAYAQLWLGSLPLKADAVEATAMHEQLAPWGLSCGLCGMRPGGRLWLKAYAGGQAPTGPPPHHHHRHHALPLTADPVTAVTSDRQVVMCEGQDPRVVPHVARVAAVFAEVLGGGKTYVAGPVGVRMAQLLHRLQGAVPAETISGVVAKFTPKQQASYATYMAGNIPE